jgi:acylphosphatase
MESTDPSSGETARIQVFVDGSVQGVGFRMFVLDYARALGLTGWVRNTYDGRVEVVAEGAYNRLEKLLEKLRAGPRGAFVTSLQNEWQPATGEFPDFNVRRTV